MFDTHRSVERRIPELNPRIDSVALDVLKQRVLDAIDAQEHTAENEIKRRHKTEANRRQREALLARIERNLSSAGRRRDASLTELTDPGDPRALLLALVMDRRPEIQSSQLAAVRKKFGEASMTVMAQSLRTMGPLAPDERTLALDTHLPALRDLSRAELRRFAQTIQEIEMQGGADVFEYAVSRTASVFAADLLDPRTPHGNRKLATLAGSIETLFAIVATHSSRGSASVM